MGFVYVDVIVHGVGMSRSIKMLVDIGSTYIVLKPDVIKELNLYETPYTAEVTLADGRKVRTKLYLAEVEVKGRKGPAFIVELDTPTPLLGVHALETLGFRVNPGTGEVEEISPEGGYLLNQQAKET
ncbi:MAG: hypothetical protein B7O98_08090 [Zestosphaera tikiterensis]|uniref:Peptidase A2 domain-containing protein n=1 Tax=Zestosphaera tikiterensis TaxID=1973259 RepID=A0A2R7Y3J7_9CREN|nr:MAG: hypothetical protein B7O98_08090 [Zestosphaera tikiterensis]